MKYFPLIVATFFLASCATQNTSSPVQPASRTSYQEDLKVLFQGEAQAEVIKKFADAVSSGKAEPALQLLWPVTKEEFGEEGWNKYITEKLQPFFKSYREIDSYERVYPITMLNDTPALVHFGYIRDASGLRQPFEIVVVSVDKESYIANIYVGNCKHDLHPVCE